MGILDYIGGLGYLHEPRRVVICVFDFNRVAVLHRSLFPSTISPFRCYFCQDGFMRQEQRAPAAGEGPRVAPSLPFRA
jgi:hypothetical protein